MITFPKIIHKKLKKLKILKGIFLYLHRHTLQTTSFPLLIFLLNSFTHIPCTMALLFWFFPIYLQNTEFFCIFVKKMAKNFFSKFINIFLRINATIGGYHPNHWVEGALLFIWKNFNKVITIAFSKVIHKKLKKPNIFSHVFL